MQNQSFKIDRLLVSGVRRQHTEVGAKCKEIFRGSGGRSPQAGSRGGAPVGGLGDSEAEAFSLNYMLILTFLIMKKCNMFIGVSCQRAIQVIRCQFRSS